MQFPYLISTGINHYQYVEEDNCHDEHNSQDAQDDEVDDHDYEQTMVNMMTDIAVALSINTYAGLNHHQYVEEDHYHDEHDGHDD